MTGGEGTTGTTSAALAVRNLSVAYGNVVAVHDATFTVAEGDACAIVGPNGNGKSSILMGVTGMIRRRGEVEVFGAPARNGDVRWAARHGLTLVPERRQLYPELSTADNILLGCYTWTRNIGKARRSGDRKSTRLNSSHPSISYAVFCLKKKKKNQINCILVQTTTHSQEA